MNQASYTVQTKINRPVAEVFAAIVDPEKLSRYFTDRTSGPLAEGQAVEWHWSQWGDYPVTVKTVVPNQLVEVEFDSTAWKKTTGAGYKVLVRMELAALDAQSTMLSISEAGWKTDAPGLKGSHDNCSGWTHMAMCLKAYLEHGLDLR